jgi:two-component system cell cycle response regulator
MKAVESEIAFRSPELGRSPRLDGDGTRTKMTKVLLVDDSKFLRIATERALARAGYEVSTAVDGERALEIAREKHPDVILLDMLLPKMAGPEVLKALKKDPATAGIAVVVFTGLSQKNAARLQQDGASAFLEKSELGLDKGCETLLTELARIVQKLHLEGPEGALALSKATHQS